jgi:thymidylate synthase (FAD)
VNGITLTSDIAVRLVQKVGGDHMVAAAAKVSTSGDAALAWADPENGEATAGLIRYLMKHRHGTPFEHASLTFFVHAPVFVWWEWVRHRIGHSFNLESGRYKELEPVFWVPRHGRKMVPSPLHKPARPSFDPASTFIEKNLRDGLRNSYSAAWDVYRDAIDSGIATEVARAALPFAVYYSGWVTVNPRSLMSFLSLRTHEDDATFQSYPQAEIEEAARSAEAAFAEGWPITYKAFCDLGRVAP